PKLTLISRPGTSCVRVTKASSGSMAGPLPASLVDLTLSDLTLSRLPAEAKARDEDSTGRPGRHHAERSRSRPQRVAAEVDPLHHLDEVLERKHVADRAQERGIAPRRAERAREERHRQQDEVDDRGRPLRRAEQRGDGE